MSKSRKVDKVEDPAASYSTASANVSKSGGAIRFADREAVLKANEKLMKVHRRVLEKLAK